VILSLALLSLPQAKTTFLYFYGKKERNIDEVLKIDTIKFYLTFYFINE